MRELTELDERGEKTARIGGWAGWLLARMRAVRQPEPRLQLLERINLAPRHSLALVEADGRRLLVATSSDGGPAFYPLDRLSAGGDKHQRREDACRPARVSW